MPEPKPGPMPVLKPESELEPADPVVTAAAARASRVDLSGDRNAFWLFGPETNAYGREDARIIDRARLSSATDAAVLRLVDAQSLMGKVLPEK